MLLCFLGGDKYMKIKIAITIDSKILELIKKTADEESRSVSSQINKILKDYFDN
jgi:hypothetical protein